MKLLQFEHMREKYDTENDLSYFKESIYMQPVISKLGKPIMLFEVIRDFFKGRYFKYFPVMFFLRNASNVWYPASLEKKWILEPEGLKGRRLKYLRSSPPLVFLGKGILNI